MAGSIMAKTFYLHQSSSLDASLSVFNFFGNETTRLFIMDPKFCLAYAQDNEEYLQLWTEEIPSLLLHSRYVSKNLTLFEQKLILDTALLKQLSDEDKSILYQIYESIVDSYNLLLQQYDKALWEKQELSSSAR